MHFINKGFLKLTLLPKALYRTLGVDVRLLQAILQAKLTIDDRRPNTMQQVRKKSEKPVTAATIGTMIVSAFIGFAYLFAFFIANDPVTALTYYFSLFFFMLSASLISDFTSVLIDVRDNYIILPKPVNDRTVVTARVLHIFIHICKVVVPMCLPGAGYIGSEFGLWATVVFLLMVLLLTLFVLFVINALYLLILRITTPQRFQAIISYIQILFAVVIYAGYQVLPRMADQVEGFTLNSSNQPLYLLLPTYWFASGWQLLYTGAGSGLDIVAVLLCIIVPVASIFIMIRYLAPSFNNRLALMGSISGTKTTPPTNQTKSESGYVRTMCRLATRRGAERMGFLFTWKITSRSRDFKLKVYPVIGYLAVYIFLILFRYNSREFDEVPGTLIKITVMGGIYITSFLLIAAVSQVRQSHHYKAAWMFFTTPLEQPGAVILGALKAAMVKFFVPMAVLVTAFSLYMAGISAIPNLLLGFLNQLLIIFLMVYINHKILPFSLPEKMKDKAGTFIRGLTLYLFIGIIGSSQYLIYGILPAVWLCALLSAIGIWYLIGSIRDTSWNKIMKEYDDHD